MSWGPRPPAPPVAGRPRAGPPGGFGAPRRGGGARVGRVYVCVEVWESTCRYGHNWVEWPYSGRSVRQERSVPDFEETRRAGASPKELRPGTRGPGSRRLDTPRRAKPSVSPPPSAPLPPLPHRTPPSLPPEAAEYLRHEAPRLALRQRLCVRGVCERGGGRDGDGDGDGAGAGAAGGEELF